MLCATAECLTKIACLIVIFIQNTEKLITCYSSIVFKSMLLDDLAKNHTGPWVFIIPLSALPRRPRSRIMNYVKAAMAVQLLGGGSGVPGVSLESIY